MNDRGSRRVPAWGRAVEHGHGWNPFGLKPFLTIGHYVNRRRTPCPIAREYHHRKQAQVIRRGSVEKESGRRSPLSVARSAFSCEKNLSPPFSSAVGSRSEGANGARAARRKDGAARVSSTSSCVHVLRRDEVLEVSYRKERSGTPLAVQAACAHRDRYLHCYAR